MRVLNSAGCLLAMSALAIGCHEQPTAVDDVDSALFAKGRKKGNPGSDDGVTWLTKGRQVVDRWPSYSPTGDIAFSRLPRGGDQYEVYTIPAVGGEPAVLWSSGALSTWGTKWSPSGDWIVFTGVYYDESDNRVSNVWVVRSNGADARQLVRSGLSNDVLWPSWYPDENYLAVWDVGDNRVLKRISCCEANDGTGAVHLTNPSQGILAGWSSVYPRIPPAEEVYVAFAGQLAPAADPYGLAQSLWIVHDDLDDTNPPAEAVRVLPSDNDMVAQAPGWSPDGNWLAFQSIPTTPETDWWNIWIVRPNGSDLQQVTESFWVKNALNPDWSPDGSLLVFSARKNPFKPDRWLAVINAPLQ